MKSGYFMPYYPAQLPGAGGDRAVDGGPEELALNRGQPRRRRLEPAHPRPGDGRKAQDDPAKLGQAAVVQPKRPPNRLIPG